MSFKPIYKLRDWINPELLVHNDLSRNPRALHIIEKNLYKFDWWSLSQNSGAISIIEKNLNNPEVISKINWNWLSENPNALHILENYIDNINIDYLAMNPNPNIIYFLKKYFSDNFPWYCLSTNPSIFIYDEDKHIKLIKKFYDNFVL